MKFRSPLAASFLLIAAGCGPTIEKEPNDNYTLAQPIGAGRVRGTVSSASDVDYYRLEVRQENAVLDVRVGGIRDVDFVLSVQDKDRVELKRADETAAGGDEQILDVGVHPGAYYIILSNKNPKADNPAQPYILDVKLRSAQGNEREPNDTALSANPIEPGSVVRGHYYPARNLLAGTTEQAEEDWFKVSIAQPGMSLLNIDLSGVPNVDPILEIYDVNFYKIREVDAGGLSEGERLRNFGVRGPAQYFLRLRSKSRLLGNPDAGYELLTELIPYRGTTEFEPNDQRQDATPFEQDSITGSISSPGDVDWYKVSVQGEGKQILSAALTGLPGMDLVMTVADDLGNPLLVIDNGDKEQPEILTGIGVARGDYYLVVSEKSGRKADPKQSYTLTKTLTPFQAGLEYELNNSSASAQAIKVGESVDGYLAPKGDVDWYQFNVYQKGGMLLEATGLLNVRLSMTLYDQDCRELRAAAAKKQGDGVTFLYPLEPGTYFVRLKAEDPGQNNVRDKYTLRLRAQ